MPKIAKIDGDTVGPVTVNNPDATLALAKKIAPWALVAIVLIAGGIVGALQYHKVRLLNNQVAALKANPQQAAESQTQDLINKVGQLIILPKGEQPTVATVTDPEKLKDQAFFANAQTGFKVLIYTNAKKAILYDPMANKIVEVAPVNIGADGTQVPTPQVAGESTTKPSTSTKTPASVKKSTTP